MKEKNILKLQNYIIEQENKILNMKYLSEYDKGKLLVYRNIREKFLELEDE